MTETREPMQKTREPRIEGYYWYHDEEFVDGEILEVMKFDEDWAAGRSREDAFGLGYWLDNRPEAFFYGPLPDRSRLEEIGQAVEVLNDRAALTSHILKTWQREDIERFALHLLGEGWQGLDSENQHFRDSLAFIATYAPQDTSSIDACMVIIGSLKEIAQKTLDGSLKRFFERKADEYRDALVRENATLRSERLELLERAQLAEIELGRFQELFSKPELETIYEKAEEWEAACGKLGEKASGLARERDLLLNALTALTDPDGHIWHGEDGQCTGECKEVQAAIEQVGKGSEVIEQCVTDLASIGKWESHRMGAVSVGTLAAVIRRLKGEVVR